MRLEALVMPTLLLIAADEDANAVHLGVVRRHDAPEGDLVACGCGCESGRWVPVDRACHDLHAS